MSRRRAYEHDDDDDFRHRKRRRTAAEPREIEDKLESLILKVGEKSTSSLESNLEQLAAVLVSDLSNFKNNVLKILVDCAQKLPEKVTIYSTLVGLLNAKNYSFGGEFVELLVKAFKDNLKTYNWDVARYCVRFFADLVNCKVLNIATLVQLYDTFIQVIHEENIPQVRSDWFVYAILSSLPWIGAELHEKKEQDLGRLMRQIDVYISQRRKAHVPALQVWSADSPHLQEEYLDCLWSQINKLKSDQWIEKHLSRPYLAFDGVLSEALQHNLPSIQIPPHSPDATYPFPSVVFRIFDYLDCPEGQVLLPGAHAIERYLIEEHLHRIIEVHHTERKQCAAGLLSFPGKSKVPFEYMITECVFGELFNLPNSRYLEICYGSILLELCKLQPSTMPLVLAQTVEILYERLDSMNTSCLDRFCSWFAYHLSNFLFRWTWEEWAEKADTYDHLHPKPKFIQGALAKCLRLSYHQRLKEIIPARLEIFLPPEPLPKIKYGEDTPEDTPGLEVSKKLSEAIKSRCTEEEALAILNQLDGTPEGEDAMETNSNPTMHMLKIDVFVHTLLAIASKTMSHSFAGVAKFHYVLKTLGGGNAEYQVQILQSMYEIWRDHPQMMQGLTDKFLKTQVIECAAVANWVFSPELKSDFMQAHIWEILHSTIRIKIKHCKKLQADLDAAKSAGTKKDRGDGDDDEEAAPGQEETDKMEEKLEAAQSDLKNLFLIIFQRFIMLLTEYIAQCESEGISCDTYWFKWALGRLQEMFFRHHEHIARYISTLESLLFSSDVDPHILQVYQQFRALRN